jgi:hypothetical protein
MLLAMSTAMEQPTTNLFAMATHLLDKHKNVAIYR